MTWIRILFIVCLLGTILALKTETIKKKVTVGKKSFKCTFKVKFTETTVDRNSSSVKCKPKKPTKKNVNVVLKTKDKQHKFKAKINLNPTSIQGIQMIPLKNLTEGYECGGYGETLTEEEKQDRSFTCRPYTLWGNGKVIWAFVSNGDSYDQHGFYTDTTIGLSKRDAELTIKAMNMIEEKVGCIKFTRTKNPDNNEPWLLVMRESKCSSGSCTCQRSYINTNLKNKQIANLGTPFSGYWGPDWDCFGGAYVAGLGAKTPSKLVISLTDGSLGLLQHELLHVLGLGHTQKRPDRDSYITVMKGNIKDEFESQYSNCKTYCGACETHGIGYDCSSIMHYTNRGFSINNRPTMVAKDPYTCDVSQYGTALTDYDVALLKKLYCKNGEIMSTNYPNRYPDYEDQVFSLKVVEGQIELTFTDFELEYQYSCLYDYVTIYNSDNSHMKTNCGNYNPGVLISKSNTMTVKFHSDYSVRRRGFKATWKQFGGKEGCVLNTETWICGGNILKQFGASSQYECASACASTDGCVGWTMRDSDSYWPHCWLRSSVSCKYKHERYITGTKACGVMNDCPANWKKGVHGCYNFMNNNENWRHAKERCKKMGAKLAEPETNEAFTELRKMAKIYHTNPSYWLGFTDKNKEGTWVRDSDQQEAFKDFKSVGRVWHAGEPNNYGSNEDCVHIRGLVGGSLLNDISCTATNVKPICQFIQNPVTYRMSVGVKIARTGTIESMDTPRKEDEGVNTERRAPKIAPNGTIERMDTPMKEDEDICTGNFQEKGLRPPAGTKCVKVEVAGQTVDKDGCVLHSGRWGKNYCWTDKEKKNWGAICVICPGVKTERRAPKIAPNGTIESMDTPMKEDEGVNTERRAPKIAPNGTIESMDTPMKEDEN